MSPYEFSNPLTVRYSDGDIAATAVLSAVTPRELFRQQRQGCANVRCVDISADGPRFLFREGEGVKRASATRMDLVLTGRQRSRSVDERTRPQPSMARYRDKTANF